MSGLRILVVLLGLSVCMGSHAQDYPSKPVRMIVPYAAGGPADIAARLVGQKLAEVLGQQFVVDNRPGAGGMIGAEAVARAAPDGYTLLVASFNEFTINPAVFPSMPYDPVRSFAPVVSIAAAPLVLATGSKAPYATVKDLIEAAKAKPGALAWSATSIASLNHISGEWLAAATGIKVLHVPFKGALDSATAIVNGDVAFGVTSVSSARSFVKAGSMRVLAVMTDKRTFLEPDWPTLAENGIQGFDAAVRVVMHVPAKTPQPVIAKLNAEVNRILGTPDVRERFYTMGVEPTGSTPEALDAAIKAAAAQIARIVEQAKIKVQ
ncbi:MAG: Bug family tripartite tricarboxylate transporter substrate binding protein [Burkholderiales bacterium]